MVERAYSAEIQADDSNWKDRSEYWRTYQPATRGARRKFKYRQPLILCGHGVRIRVDHNTLLIRNGFTHYPQETEEFRFFPGDANLPDRIIILDSDGGISFDALNWMSEQNIEFVRLNWRGEITNVGGRSGYAGNSKLIQAQNNIRGTKTEIELARYLIAEKIDASIQTLKVAVPKSEKRIFAIARLTKNLYEIRDPREQYKLSAILGVEGLCAAAYFGAWHNLPIKWTGLKRKPIPNHWFEIIPRTMSWRQGSRNARHPVNAMLNYGYGILANQLRTQIISVGLDPTIGILHGNWRNRIPLVYDLMEPLRPVVDRAILHFVLSHTFTQGDFTINNLGGCRLNPQMAKTITSLIGGIKVDHILRAFVGTL